MGTELAVCMIVYNGEKYLRQCIESVLNQTLHDFKFIIYDDGSTDGTVGIVESFHDDRIKLLSGGENRGGIWARTQLILAIDTEYNMWIDADDFFCDANALRFALDEIKSRDFDMVNFVCWKSVFKDGMNVNQSNYWENEEFMYFGDKLFEKRFPVENCYAFWSKIFKTELLRKSIPEDSLLTERMFCDDTLFMLMAFFLAKRYYHKLDGYAPFYAYREGIGIYGSVSGSCSKEHVRKLCRYYSIVVKSVYNRMREVREPSVDEVNRLVSGIGFGMIADKIRKTRLEKGDAEADELKAVWDEYIGADGVHFFNGCEDFKMPWMIDKYNGMM